MAHQPFLERSPLIPKRVLEPILWICIAIAACMTLCRVSVRFFKGQSFRPDLGFLVISLVLLIGSGVCYQMMIEILYDPANTQAEQVFVAVEESESLSRYMKLQFASITLVYATVLMVKASFLLLARARQRISLAYDCFWWFTLGFVFLSWLGCMVSLPIFGSPFIYGKGNNLKPWLTCSTCFDVISDLLVLALYSLFCWKLKGERKWSIALGGLFLLVVAVALASVARVAVGNFTAYGPEPSWFALCSVIEAALAVCICCLASYVGLFIDSNGFCEKAWAKLDPEKGRRRPKYPFSHTKPFYGQGTHTSAFFNAQEKNPKTDILKSPVPADAVKVKTELVVENEPMSGVRFSQTPLPRRASESRPRPMPLHNSYVRTYPGREPFVYQSRPGRAPRHRPSLSWQSSSDMVPRVENAPRIENAAELSKALRTSTPPFKLGPNGMEIQGPPR